MLLSAAYDYNKLICRCDSRLDEDYYRYTINSGILMQLKLLLKTEEMLLLLCDASISSLYLN